MPRSFNQPDITFPPHGYGRIYKKVSLADPAPSDGSPPSAPDEAREGAPSDALGGRKEEEGSPGGLPNHKPPVAQRMAAAVPGHEDMIIHDSDSYSEDSKEEFGARYGFTDADATRLNTMADEHDALAHTVWGMREQMTSLV